VIYRVNGREVSADEFASGPENEARLREMLEAGRPPCVKDDTTFMRGRHWQQQQEMGNARIRDHLLAEARRGGVDPTGKVYSSAIAAFPGDPRAWVDSRADVEKVCRERGYVCEGEVTVKAREVEHVREQVYAADQAEVKSRVAARAAARAAENDKES
jgi:hypothetical protein